LLSNRDLHNERQLEINPHIGGCRRVAQQAASVTDFAEPEAGTLKGCKRTYRCTKIAVYKMVVRNLGLHSDYWELRS